MSAVELKSLKPWRKIIEGSIKKYRTINNKETMNLIMNKIFLDNRNVWERYIREMNEWVMVEERISLPKSFNLYLNNAIKQLRLNPIDFEDKIEDYRDIALEILKRIHIVGVGKILKRKVKGKRIGRRPNKSKRIGRRPNKSKRIGRRPNKSNKKSKRIGRRHNKSKRIGRRPNKSKRISERIGRRPNKSKRGNM
jgi:hypothetical protein